MGNILSKDIQQIIIKAILGLIALVFVFWGFGGYNTRKSVIVASVNGIEITRTEHDRAYERMLANFKNQMKQVQGDIAEGLLQKLDFKRRALDEMIKVILVEQEAKKLNLSVNNHEVKEAIKNYPEFQHEGRFNLEKYKSVLRQNRILPTDFERSRKDMLILSKIENIIRDSVQVSEDEVLNEYKRRNEKVSIDFIAFNPIDYLDEIKVTAERQKKYFDENASEFDIPQKVRVEVLAFENDEYAKKVRIEEEEIKGYYEANIAEFALEEEVRVSHILIKSALGDDPQVREDARKEAEDILKKIDFGEDFVSLAKKYSEDKDTAINGGDLGWFKREEGAGSIGMVAFSMEVGEVSDVTALKDGFHIVKVLDRKEERKKELSSVKESIIQKLSLEKGTKKIEDLTRQARKEVFVSKDVTGYAKRHGLKVITPKPFAFGDKVEGIGKHTVFSREAFDVVEGDVSDIIDLSAGSYIVKVIEKMPSKTPEYAEVKEVVKERVKEVMSRELADEKANDALNKVKKGKTLLEDVAKELKLAVEHSESFPLVGASAPKIGVSEELVSAAFGLAAEKPYPNKIFTVNNKRYLIKFKSKDDISMDEYKKEHPLILRQLRMGKTDSIFTAYVEELMEKADIKIFQEL